MLKMVSKEKPKVMEDDVSSNESLDLNDEKYDFSSDNLDYENLSGSEGGDDEDLKKPRVKKVANIMNKLLSAKEGSTILSKLQRKSDSEFSEEDKEDSAEKETKPERVKLKRKWRQMSRIKPDLNDDYEKERRLKIIATQGVVQLFSTIEKHKSGLKEHLKDVETVNEREKIFAKKGMDSFMNLLDEERKKLQSGPKIEEGVKTEIGRPIKRESSQTSGWNVFAQNYYQEPNFSGWDKCDSDDG